MTSALPVQTCLWFDGDAEAASALYTALIPGSAITRVTRMAPEGPALMVNFHLAGVPYQALNGGPQFKHSPAVSISVSTPDQAETDRLWEALLADGGQPSQCAWLTDRFGLSWQIVPEALPRLLGAADRAAAGRAMQAMLQMGKIDIAALEAAFQGD